MSMILPPLVLTTAVFIAFILNDFRFFSFRVSEQTRLDAVTVSLCHERRRFLQREIEVMNHGLKGLRATMEISAALCTTPKGFLACPAIRKFIQAQGRLARSLEVAQDLARRTFVGRLLTKKESLRHHNKLDEPISHHTTMQGLRDGLEREPLNAVRKSLEKAFGTTWPQPLQPTKDFDTFNRIYTSYKPEVRLTGVAPQSREFEGLRVFSHPSKHLGAARSESACRVIYENHTYKVVAR